MTDARTLRCFDYVNQSYEVVRDAIAADPRRLFEAAGSAASDRARTVATGLKVDMGAIELGAQIEVELGTPVYDEPAALRLRHRTRLPLRWKATRAPGMFPSVIADLTISPLSHDETQLDLECEYRPPGGALGAALDTVVLHRIAEAAIHRFLSEIAAHLRRELAAT